MTLLIYDVYAVEPDVQKSIHARSDQRDAKRAGMGAHALVDGFEGATNAEIVLELDDDFLVGERLEERKDQLGDSDR